ncbi:MAG: TrmH family RNA methyltransferase, partial [bacterium]
DAVILGPECTAWHNPKTLRATMGAIFHLPVIEAPNFQQFLADMKKSEAKILLADQAGKISYTYMEYTSKKILLIGNETHGVSEACKKLADDRVAIPRRGKGESLNAAIAAAILIAEISQKPHSVKAVN